jgi:energy-coupling factor transporter ATP-binding protein EcfA2
VRVTIDTIPVAPNVVRLDQLKQGNHGLVAGMTGSGKTTLMQAICSGTFNTICIDTKHELKWPGFKITGDLDAALLPYNAKKNIGGFAIYRPPNVREIEKLFQRVYAEWGWTVYVDEVYQIGVSEMGKRTVYPPAYTRCLTAGRSRGVTIWTGTQRPKYFPLFAGTEASYFFIFELGSADDRKDLYRMVGLDEFDEERQATLKKYEFLYYSRESKQAVRSKLILK